MKRKRVVQTRREPPDQKELGVQVGNRVLMVCIRNAERLLTLRSSDAAGLVWVSSTPSPVLTDSQGPPASILRGTPALALPPNGPVFWLLLIC